jgi:hypothetical protein
MGRMMTVELIIAEAALDRARTALERQAASRIIRVFRRQAHAFPALRVAQHTTERFSTRIMEAGPQDEELLGTISAVWADGTNDIAAAIERARIGASRTSGSLTLAQLGYDQGFSVGEAVLAHIR